MPWLLIGFSTYIITAALGTSAQLGIVNTHPFRWLHHVLFAAVWVTLLALLVSAWIQGHPWFWVIVPIAFCMVAMPFLRAGTRSHCTTALIGFGCYFGAVAWAILGNI